MCIRDRLRASNGREALEVLAQENVDVIVSDVMMPDVYKRQV